MKKMLLAAVVAVLLSSCSQGDMSFRISNDGLLSLRMKGRTMVENSPVGLMLVDGNLQAPQKASKKGETVTLSFESGEVVLNCKKRENGSLRLEVQEIPEEAESFLFGPYTCPEATEVGTLLGAAWNEDGSVTCIQSLNTKTSGGLERPFQNDTPYPSPDNFSAKMLEKGAILSCSATNYTVSRSSRGRMTEPVPAPKGCIEGTAIVLTCAQNGKDLLQDIGKIEQEEGLPHPTIDGEWAKTSPHASDIYFVYGGGSIEQQLSMAEKANVHWIYFSDPFASWGHFDINRNLYPGGEEEFHKCIEKAHEKGINVGFHTLSNFIHTRDPYVSPVPHKDLLDYDATSIAEPLSESDEEIHLEETLNYGAHHTLSAVRIEDEIIQFGGLDAEQKVLTGCRRGAFGTEAKAHEKGATITHLLDHGYGTLFPRFCLQGEMADRIGDLLHNHDIRRMSFDGLEGCLETGLGQFGVADFVDHVCKKAGDNLICDASGGFATYLWHVFSYFNWGEPWYDYQLRGGMYNYRAHNLDYFRLNLLPGMLGWYTISNGRGHFEPTLPETLEFILSRTVAFDAGLCFNLSLGESPKMDEFLKTIALWQDFRFHADVPQELKDRMKEQSLNWHLEMEDDHFVLSEIQISDHDFAYLDREVKTESGTTGYQVYGESLKPQEHVGNLLFDRHSPSKDFPDIQEPLKCRIRVGTATCKGKLCDLKFCGGFFSTNPILGFSVAANAGDYLEYTGGTTLRHYDSNYNLLETIEGEGTEIVPNPASISYYSPRYTLLVNEGDDVPVTMKLFQTSRQYILPRTDTPQATGEK